MAGAKSLGMTGAKNGAPKDSIELGDAALSAPRSGEGTAEELEKSTKQGSHVPKSYGSPSGTGRIPQIY
ncbi:hypothetical protein M427DRAFT_138704 [Gonapodya prolifera JEL478]|uniref:Uncharacterized protein n=1 Tax=Gonapodya prolifera (strain JEL478) TaxID=1344416 RepID=A0A139A362_GONPJ|nr:hypothetical protein M427DRAFT_138704 [Gonapodya prolifera JEL478]|eukprot:KXS11068.1 hypothetical protein M427DRAFT_138704 [Gonapodya prolifera JEL478]